MQKPSERSRHAPAPIVFRHVLVLLALVLQRGFDFCFSVCRISHEVHDIFELFHRVFFGKGNCRSVCPDMFTAIFYAGFKEKCRPGAGRLAIGFETSSEVAAAS